MIVDITPVALGRGHVPTTASVKDLGTGSGDGGGGLGGKKVCICNTNAQIQARLLQQQSIQQAQQLQKQQQQIQSQKELQQQQQQQILSGATQKLVTPNQQQQPQHGSLDKLLQDVAEPIDTTNHQQATTGVLQPGEVQKFYQQINGDIIEWTATKTLKTKPPTNKETSTNDFFVLSKKSTFPQQLIRQHSSGILRTSSSSTTQPPPPTQVQLQQQQPQQQQQLPQKSPQQYTPQSLQQQNQFSKAKDKLTEFLDQISTAPTPLLRSLSKRKSTEIDSSSSARPISAPREDYSTEYFDRTQQERHSSRSTGVCDESKRWYDEGNTHQRHSSGPTDLSFLKDETIAEWLLSLTRKHHDEKSSVKESRGPDDVFKKPLHRQSSGPSEISVLKSDIVEWLTRQQQISKGATPKQKDKSSKYYQGHSSQSQSKKRHSLGPHEIDHDEPVTTHSYTQYPLSKLPSLIRDKTPPVQSSCIDISKKSQDRHEHRSHRHERKLRHSASEVVQSTIENTPPPKPERQFMKQLAHQLSQPPPRITSHHQQQLSSSAAQSHHSVLPSYSHVIKQSSFSKDEQQLSSTKSSRSRRHQTQRSATVSNISVETRSQQQSHHSELPRKSSSAERADHEIMQQQQPLRLKHRSSSLTRCTDPLCPLLPVCNDPNCCYSSSCLDYCNMSQCTSKYSQIQNQQKHLLHDSRICRDVKCSSLCYEYRCYSLPRCIDSKCSTDMPTICKDIIKCNSLPRCAESYRSTSVTYPSTTTLATTLATTKATTQQHNHTNNMHHKSQQSLIRGDSRSSLPHTKSKLSHRSHSASNGKLIKSISAVSLNSRRRRHKTVHFGENLLREVCQNRKLIKPIESSPSTESGATATALQPNIQMLYNFVEGVLSAWVDEEEDDENIKSGPDSEPERGAIMKPMHRCNRARLQTIRRVVTEAAVLKGTLKLGNSRYRHRHWRGTAKECNERFLRKVI